MFSDDVAIKVENLSKCFEIYETPRDRLKQFLLPRVQRVLGIQPRRYYREFWALKDISFEVKKGETVGIIGRNGSGKSTLLQMICGTLRATGGSIQTNGRIAALLELGSGFNPEFTGRENVYLNCALLGLSREETDARFDDIAAFADIGEFIEQPVKTYSSGMYVRLAFAVNIVSRPDIMIVDEALAVGDMAFQAKCMTALTRIQDNGATVLFVSHDIGSIKSLCNRAIYLSKGELVSIGRGADVADQYIKVTRNEMGTHLSRVLDEKAALQPEKYPTALGSKKIEFKRSVEFERRVALFRYGQGGVRITCIELVNMEGEKVQSVEFNQEVKVIIYFDAEVVRDISVNFYVCDDKKVAILGGGFKTVGQNLLTTAHGGRYRAEYVTFLPLSEGNYSIMAQISTPVVEDQSATFLDVVPDAVVFNVRRRKDGVVWSKVYLFPTLELVRVSDEV